MTVKKVDFLIPIVTILLLFFTVKEGVPIYVYLLIVAPVAFYYFPIKIFIFNKLNGNSSLKDKIIVAGSNFLFSMIYSFTVLHLYIENNEIVNAIIATLGGISFLGMIYYFLTEKKNNNAIVHLCYSILASSVLYF